MKSIYFIEIFQNDTLNSNPIFCDEFKNFLVWNIALANRTKISYFLFWVAGINEVKQNRQIPVTKKIENLKTPVQRLLGRKFDFLMEKTGDIYDRENLDIEIIDQ